MLRSSETEQKLSSSTRTTRRVNKSSLAKNLIWLSCVCWFRQSTFKSCVRQRWKITRRPESLTVKAAISEKGWSERRSSSNYPVKEITTKSSASAGNLTSYSLTSKLNTNLKQNVLFFLGMPTSRRSLRPTGNWHSSGIQTTSSLRRRRRKRKRNLLT